MGESKFVRYTILKEQNQELKKLFFEIVEETGQRNFANLMQINESYISNVRRGRVGITSDKIIEFLDTYYANKK